MFIQTWHHAKLLLLSFITITIIGLANHHWLISITGILLTSWLCYFFRDPLRQPESAANDLSILSPADGTITAINHLDTHEFIKGPTTQITIFLSIFNVHVQRAPYAGTVKIIKYQPGSFKPAFLQHADTNESNSIGIRTQHGKLLVKQMTGILARRIVCLIKPQQTITRSQKLGLIKFGSRVDLFLPAELPLTIKPGQKVYTGHTIIAQWPA